MPRPQLDILPDGRLQLTSSHQASDLPNILGGALHLAADYIDGDDGRGHVTTDGRQGVVFVLRFLAELVPNEYQIGPDRRESPAKPAR